jgi:hypothetical protein
MKLSPQDDIQDKHQKPMTMTVKAKALANTLGIVARTIPEGLSNYYEDRGKVELIILPILAGRHYFAMIKCRMILSSSIPSFYPLSDTNEH